MKARFHAYNLELSAEYLHNMILLTVYITFVELSNVRGRVVIFKYSTISHVHSSAQLVSGGYLISKLSTTRLTKRLFAAKRKTRLRDRVIQRGELDKYIMRIQWTCYSFVPSLYPQRAAAAAQNAPDNNVAISQIPKPELIY